MTGTRSRVWLWVAGGVTAVLCVGCVAVWEITPIRWSSPPPLVGMCAISTSVPARPTAPSAPSGGGVRVVEQGFSQIDGNWNVVRVGAIVENTSSMVAYQTPVRVLVLDANGRSAVAPRSGELLSLMIPVLMPGERIGVGSWTFLISSDFGVAVRVASVEIVLGSPQWWPTDDPTVRFGSVVVMEADWGSDGRVAYTMDSPYCGDVPDRGVAVVFRNSAGAIIGGHITSPISGGCPAGPARKSATLIGDVPADIDGSKIEVFPYCDPVPRRREPLSTERAAN